MAEMVSSIIVKEVMDRTISSLIGKADVKSQDRGNMERLEMAHIKMEAVLQMSNRWQIIHVPLLRWQTKLKRASEECNETLRRCRQRAMEEEEVRQSSFPKRIAHVTKKLMSSSFTGYSNDELGSGSSTTTVRRFERFAAGATEFLKYVELGGTPWKYMFFNPLIGHLLRGKSMRYQAFQESKCYYIGIRPMIFADRGVEVIIGFLCHDFKEPTNGFNVGIILRLSESTDIFNVIIMCMESVTPHFEFAAEGVKRELIQLPTQDFSWATQSPYGQNDLWVNVHNTLTHWSRQIHFVAKRMRKIWSLLLTSTTQWYRHQGCLSQCDQYSKGSAAEHGVCSYQNSDMPPLKLGVLFIPHDSPKDIEPAAESYALEVIDEKRQGMVHNNNLCLQYLDEKLLPKAIDYLYQHSESKMYQICLKYRHGSAHLCVEKGSTRMQRDGRVKSKATRNARNKKIAQLDEDNRMERWKQLSKDMAKLWGQRPNVGHTYDVTNLMKLWALN
ncbi:unnamed protein product [Urochloa decumbens]|uniref:Uncharacterized protein n=1 Tax=Urochloa decumbens TaxID=240449 RepID=A0ABC9AV35_9POAL